MPGLMSPKNRQAVQVIMGKLSGASTSENSSEALKKKNEDSMEEVSLESKDEVNNGTAIEAASSSLMSALDAKDSKQMASALMDLFELFDLAKESREVEPSGEAE